jgi:hypothetical protein
MVDVNKKGQVNIPGDLSVKNNMTASNLSLGNDLNVSGESVLNNLTIKGDITVFGKLNKINENDEETTVIKNGLLYLGDPEVETTWRIRIEDGGLFFEQKLNNEWLCKQSIF